jgi:hypothetical protein
MARPKSNKNTNGAQEVLTRKEAVRRVLEKHGQDITTADIQKYTKEEYGFDLSIPHVYNIKSTLKSDASGKKAKKKGKKRGGRRKKAQAESQPAAARATNGKNQSGLSFRDLEAVKELKTRLGAKSLHALIDMLG